MNYSEHGVHEHGRESLYRIRAFSLVYAVGCAVYTSQPCNAERYRLRNIHAREIVAVYGLSPGPSVTRLIS
jgi:hypothetical protein